MLLIYGHPLQVCPASLSTQSTAVHWVYNYCVPALFLPYHSSWHSWLSIKNNGRLKLYRLLRLLWSTEEKIERVNISKSPIQVLINIFVVIQIRTFDHTAVDSISSSGKDLRVEFRQHIISIRLYFWFREEVSLSCCQIDLICYWAAAVQPPPAWPATWPSIQETVNSPTSRFVGPRSLAPWLVHLSSDIFDTFSSLIPNHTTKHLNPRWWLCHITSPSLHISSILAHICSSVNSSVWSNQKVTTES